MAELQPLLKPMPPPKIATLDLGITDGQVPPAIAPHAVAANPTPPTSPLEPTQPPPTPPPAALPPPLPQLKVLVIRKVLYRFKSKLLDRCGYGYWCPCRNSIPDLPLALRLTSVGVPMVEKAAAEKAAAENAVAEKALAEKAVAETEAAENVAAAASAESAMGIEQVLGYRLHMGNEQWRVRWSGTGVESDTEETWRVLDTPGLRERAQALKSA